MRPFSVGPQELASHLDDFVTATYADLESSFLVLPKGQGFVEYGRFVEAYEQLKHATGGFREFSPDRVWTALRAESLVFLVLRTILGMTPPEWAALVPATAAVIVDRGTVRSLDQKMRTQSDYIAHLNDRRNAKTIERIDALVRAACDNITQAAPAGTPETIHRLNKIDTAEGLASLQRVAALHVPYAVLLYERYLGRPFASQRDSVSEHIGDALESAIEGLLLAAGISNRKTKRAGKVPGFDQAPDFVIPDEIAPQIVIEAKIANDDGTARDKITRIIHLTDINREWVANGHRGFEVVACIDGPGFGVRREDMRRLLTKLDGKVFTLRTLDQMIPHTGLARFVTTRQTPT